MKKITLYLLLSFFSVCSLYLGYRLYVQAQEFEEARQVVERQTEELFVFRELLNQSDLKIDNIRKFLRENYPNEDLGTYSQQIQWRGIDFYFPDSTIAVYSSTSSSWTCGTLFGCVTDHPEFLTSYTNTIVGHFFAYSANYFAYPVLFIFFLIALYRIYKLRIIEKSEFKKKCYAWSCSMLFLTIFIAFGSATIWWDIVLNTSATPSLLYAGWNELWLRIGVGVLFSVILIFIGLYGQRFIPSNRNSAEAL